MEQNKNQVMALMSAPMNSDFSIDNSSLWDNMNGTDGSPFNEIAHDANLTGWNYWQNYYYPQVIRESYPVYIQERSQDKGKQAFEILKTLQDKGLTKIEKVEDFIKAMDSLIKIL